MAHTGGPWPRSSVGSVRGMDRGARLLTICRRQAASFRELGVGAIIAASRVANQSNLATAPIMRRSRERRFFVLTRVAAV